MTTIKLTDAAKHYEQLPHQIAAWNALQGQLTPKQLSEFTELYRASSTGAQDPFRPSSPFSYKLTPHITYSELCLNSERRRFTKQYQCDTALFLCQFIEKARTHFGNRPVIITSCHRPPAINLQVGGSSTSEHLFNAPDKGAVDWCIDGLSVHTLQEWCKANWAFSTGLGAPQFVHTGIRPGRPKVVWTY
jgi:hypothetical protein